MATAQSGLGSLNDLEVRSVIEDAIRASSRLYKVEDGLLISLEEAGKPMEPKDGLGLVIGYSAGSFMTVDRTYMKDDELVREKRMINRLNNQSGQINTALLLELLSLDHMIRISKYELVGEVQEKYFGQSPMGTRDITEALNRMLRKTMKDYFAFAGRFYHKAKFHLKFIELEPQARYSAAKMHIDSVVRL